MDLLVLAIAPLWVKRPWRTSPLETITVLLDIDHSEMLHRNLQPFGWSQSSDAVTTGSYNTSWGNLSLSTLTTGSSNIAIGYRALTTLDTWSHSVAIGRDAGAERSHHNNCTLIGGELVRSSWKPQYSTWISS